MIVSNKKLSYKEAEYLLALGFKIQKRQESYKISLPDNWYFNIVNKKRYLIFDEKKRCRGEYIVNPKKDSGRIFLYPRYSIIYKNSNICIYDRRNETKLTEINIFPFEKWKMRRLFEMYLDKVYPCWRNPINYWG